MKTLCLNMIVKNEAKIIERLLDSVVDLIDCFCIIDTGSSDDTVDVIMKYFDGKGISGKIGFYNFVNFEKTRNDALKMTRGMSDYILLLDADMVLEHSINKNKLDKDYYYIYQGNNQLRYHNTRIIKNDGSFYYRGVTHEVILSTRDAEGEFLEDKYAYIIDYEDGGCKENKLERDKNLLLQNIDDPETQTRYYFYLGNTLTALGETEEAIKYYEKRLEKGGWTQELWCTCYKLGCLYYIRNDFIKASFYFLDAYNYEPKRVENLYYLTVIYKNIKRNNIAEIYLNLALDIIKNKNLTDGDLFLEPEFYQKDIWDKI